MALVAGRAEVGNTTTPNVGYKNKPRVKEHSCWTPMVCHYLGSDGRPCLERITCATAPEHLESHGVKSISRMASVVCRWEGCLEACLRHNFVRHVREKHLAHTRGPATRSSHEDSRQHSFFHEEADDAGSRNDSRVNERSEPQLCQYQDPDGRPCLQYITPATVSAHFANCHGVKAMSRGQLIACRWDGCGNKRVLRHSFVRHIREKHLGHARGSALRKSEKAGG